MRYRHSIGKHPAKTEKESSARPWPALTAISRTASLQASICRAWGKDLLVAEDEKAGAALLSMKIDGAQKVVLPTDNEAGLAFLKAEGFTEKTRMRRMVHGERFAWEPRYIYSRIGGFLG